MFDHLDTITRLLRNSDMLLVPDSVSNVYTMVKRRSYHTCEKPAPISCCTARIVRYGAVETPTNHRAARTY